MRPQKHRPHIQADCARLHVEVYSTYPRTCRPQQKLARLKHGNRLVACDLTVNDAYEIQKCFNAEKVRRCKGEENASS